MSGMHSMVSPIAGSNLVTENHAEVTLAEFAQALREGGVELVEFRGKFVRIRQSPTVMPELPMALNNLDASHRLERAIWIAAEERGIRHVRFARYGTHGATSTVQFRGRYSECYVLTPRDRLGVTREMIDNELYAMMVSKFDRLVAAEQAQPQTYSVEDYGNHEVTQVEALTPEEAAAKWTHDSICEGSNRDMAVVDGRLYTAGPIRSLYWVSCDSEEVPDAEVWVETPPGFGGPSELPE